KRKFACVECRQQKSKCDACERAPEPCTKCAKKNVPCILKRDFRRTYKRARNEAIEKRFKELTRTLTNLTSDE
uniref:Regulatory protein LEU3 n=1 Tax=Saccharomyces cerevisiae TaxID=4932 RepID=UPI0000D4FBAA|nr:Chain A, Regulatory protein LEU3 [Saccharomyces cerevisiae]2ERG_B Chain B, Regulatory protein LEU3 [Saccharomyces cerevisiae]